MHIEVDGHKTVVEAHDIAVQVRNQVMAKHPVLNVMTHIDPVV
ncbi:MAG TPA: cation transporter dimerization domain-containing protein [Pseudomonadales bacterium]|nr:cation transporter dimerization domain-containing protein [Pseudomonadales bacterium]